MLLILLAVAVIIIIRIFIDYSIFWLALVLSAILSVGVVILVLSMLGYYGGCYNVQYYENAEVVRDSKNNIIIITENGTIITKRKILTEIAKEKKMYIDGEVKSYTVAVATAKIKWLLLIPLAPRVVYHYKGANK